MSYFWRRSLAASAVAARLAEPVLPRARDEVFVAALLADIGIPILAEVMPERYGAILANFAPNKLPASAEEERKAVGASHGEVSAMVLAHWTLPENVHGAVNLHQSSQPGHGEIATMARILHAADRMAMLLCEIPSLERILQVSTAAAEFVGVGIECLEPIIRHVEKDIGELAGVLRIDVIPNKVYSLIEKTLNGQQMSAGAAR
jgi:HD-like signal output (HDOD) protein